MPIRLLVVEDDPATAELLSGLLVREGYEVRTVHTAADALAAVRQGVDALLLDLGLPDRDGLALCRELRAQGHELPILVVTARTSEVDLVLALDAGADDYVIKPFRSRELVARVRAALRRRRSSAVLAHGRLRIDLGAVRVTVGGEPLELTPKEFEILVLLGRKWGDVVRREELIAALWTEPLAGNSKSLDMHLSAVRRKLAAAGLPDCISTVRGAGYRLEP